MAYKTINPYTNELIKEYTDSTDEESESTMQMAKELYKKFKTQDIEGRAKLLREIAKTIRNRSDEMARTLTTEMGKLIGGAEGEVELIATFADWFADHSEEMLAPQAIETQANVQAKFHHLSN